MRTFACVVALLALICLTISCTNKQPEPAKAPLTAKAFVPPDPATTATVSGMVHFNGKLPAPQKIDMSQDPACGAQSNFDPSLIVSTGAIANVFVYVKGAFDDVSFPLPAAPVVINQKGCRYDPHVAVALVGQDVEFENGDQTTHNVHMMPAQLKQWNESQMPGAEPIVKRFDRPEIMIPIKCNQHPWMRMYLNVVNHPFFAVTGQDGKFQISSLPPGTYTIAAVHERLGEQDVKVTVGPKESRDIQFTFQNVP